VNLTTSKTVCYKFRFDIAALLAPMSRGAIIKVGEVSLKSWLNVAKSAAKDLSSGTMFLTQTTERRAGLIQIYNQSGCKCRKAVHSAGKFVRVALRPEKLLRPPNYQI
jgi:hypothetical protein